MNDFNHLKPGALINFKRICTNQSISREFIWIMNAKSYLLLRTPRTFHSILLLSCSGRRHRTKWAVAACTILTGNKEGRGSRHARHLKGSKVRRWHGQLDNCLREYEQSFSGLLLPVHSCPFHPWWILLMLCIVILFAVRRSVVTYTVWCLQIPFQMRSKVM